MYLLAEDLFTKRYLEYMKMKKHLLPPTGLLFIASTQTASFVDSKGYITLEEPVVPVPPALKLFSFYCPSCYQYDEAFEITGNVKEMLPADVKLIEYHADFLGPLGQDMIHTWFAAMLSGVQDKVKLLFFNAVQKKQIVRTADDICNAFINAGVNASNYDVAWNSSAMKSLTAKQQKVAKAADLIGVPATFINGKYMINPEGLDSDDLSAFAQNYADMVRSLIGKSWCLANFIFRTT